MKKIFLKLLLWLIILAPIFFISLYLYLFEVKHKDRFYSGVVIAGEHVGGKTYAEVFNYFGKKADLLTKNGITFSIIGSRGTKEIQVPMFSSGFTTDKVVEYFSLGDWESVLNQAYKIGRKGSLWQRIKERFGATFYGENFVFSPVSQKDSLESFLNNNLSAFLLKSSLAQFVFSNNKVLVLPEVSGEKINVTKISDDLNKKLTTFDISVYNLKTENDAPIVTVKDLEPFSDAVTKLGSLVKINFRYNNYIWRVSGNTLVSWITIKNDNEIGIDEYKLKDYFSKTVNFYIDSPMQNSRFEIRENMIVEISTGSSGNVIDIKKNVQEIENSISNIMVNWQDMVEEIVEIQIAVITNEPNITKDTINKYDIKELVATATTNFKGGSLDRQHNIEIGVSKLNGLLLAPGEEFSTLNAIGEITKETGFVEEYVISNGKTQKEIGGGLCQLSTTLFRLALNAGLPIIERANHRYVISYYGAGLDATIYGPHPDLRFKNDTGNYLLLQGKVNKNEVIFEFYGKKDGRVITISEPKSYNWISPPPTKNILTRDLPTGKIKCTEISHKGVTTDVMYIVNYPDGQIKETNFRSVYQPWQKVCLVGI